MPLRDYIPEPTIVMTGCRPWDSQAVAPGACPVCGPGVQAGHDSHHCAKCDSSSPAIETRIRTARIGLRARAAVEVAERNARDELRKKRTLTESERRRIWNGYKGGISHSRPEPTNRARIGREWLLSISQAPDWTLILDRHGRVVGRLGAPAE